MSLELCTVRPFSAALGAEISGVSVGEMTGSVFRRVLDAWHEHSVIVLRDQKLTMPALVSWSGRFGVPDQAAPQERELIRPAGAQQVMIVSNIVQNGKAIGHLGNKEAAWHTDMSYMPCPPIASLLYAVEVPPTGGDTGFMNMYRVYESLPPALRKRVADLSIKHDRSYTAVGDLRHGYDPVIDVRAAPGAVHPMLRQHPVSGRIALFLGRRLNAYVVGLTVAESEALLDELWEYTNAEDVTWHHKWRVGDLAIWDNRCVMHRRDAFDQRSRRLMWRTQVQADSTIVA